MTSIVTAARVILVVVGWTPKLYYKYVTKITFVKKAVQLHASHVGSLCQSSCSIVSQYALLE